MVVQRAPPPHYLQNTFSLQFWWTRVSNPFWVVLGSLQRRRLSIFAVSGWSNLFEDGYADAEANFIQTWYISIFLSWSRFNGVRMVVSALKKTCTGRFCLKSARVGSIRNRFAALVVVLDSKFESDLFTDVYLRSMVMYVGSLEDSDW